MKRLLALVCLASTLAIDAADRAKADETLMAPHVAARLGLTEAWQRTIATPNGGSSIADQQLFVHDTNPHVYVEIIEGAKADPKPKPAKPDATPPAATPPVDDAKVLARIAVDVPDESGLPVGLKEAERLASNEIRRLKRRGVEASMRTTEVRRVYLYSIADDGTLEARDAETGRPIWLTRVGMRGLSFGQLGVSEKVLTVVNGSNMIQVNAEDGIVLAEMRTMGSPQFGAINSGDYAMIVTIGGGLEGYPLADPTADPFREMVAGRALASPTRSPSSSKIAWATDQQFVYVMELLGTPSTLFRLHTDGSVVGRVAAASDDRFFFASETGQVYGMKATRSGEVLWATPFGEPFFEEPVILDNQLLVLSAYGRMFCLNTESGDLMWDQPASNIDHILGGFGDQIFAVTQGGSMTVINRDDGATIGTYADVRPGRLLPNTKTNRLYLVSDSGVVQCMRPIDSDMPKFSRQPQSQAVAEEKTEKKKDAGTSSPFDAPGTDPFGAGGADPFGAGGADPFGAGAADPFGAPAGDTADPFGSDPFGN